LTSLYDKFQNYKNIIMNGCKKVGIVNALKTPPIEDEYPFLDCYLCVEIN